MNRAKNYHFTSALGQIGSESVPALKRCYGLDHIVDSDVRILAVSDIDAALSEFALFAQRQKEMSGSA
jgi:hypothetical protein